MIVVHSHVVFYRDLAELDVAKDFFKSKDLGAVFCVRCLYEPIAVGTLPSKVDVQSLRDINQAL